MKKRKKNIAQKISKKKEEKKEIFEIADPVFDLTLSLNTTGHRAQVLCKFLTGSYSSRSCKISGLNL
jgi:hypothetical protein